MSSAGIPGAERSGEVAAAPANHRIIPSDAALSIGFTSDGTSFNGPRVCDAFMFTRVNPQLSPSSLFSLSVD